MDQSERTTCVHPLQHNSTSGATFRRARRRGRNLQGTHHSRAASTGRYCQHVQWRAAHRPTDRRRRVPPRPDPRCGCSEFAGRGCLARPCRPRRGRNHPFRDQRQPGGVDTVVATKLPQGLSRGVHGTVRRAVGSMPNLTPRANRAGVVRHCRRVRTSRRVAVDPPGRARSRSRSGGQRPSRSERDTPDPLSDPHPGLGCSVRGTATTSRGQ